MFQQVLWQGTYKTPEEKDCQLALENHVSWGCKPLIHKGSNFHIWVNSSSQFIAEQMIHMLWKMGAGLNIKAIGYIMVEVIMDTWVDEK